jgi:Flp pilus assembly pilin Flp
MLTSVPSPIHPSGPFTGVSTMLSLVIRMHESRSRGQGLAEYALVLALIAVVAIGALVFLGTRVSSVLSGVGKSI